MASRDELAERDIVTCGVCDEPIPVRRWQQHLSTHPDEMVRYARMIKEVYPRDPNVTVHMVRGSYRVPRIFIAAYGMSDRLDLEGVEGVERVQLGVRRA